MNDTKKISFVQDHLKFLSESKSKGRTLFAKNTVT